MKVIVLVIKLFLFPDVEEELSYVYPTMEACLMEKTSKESSLPGFRSNGSKPSARFRTSR